MSCPYCLAFSREGARGPQKSRRTLVRAYWEFEEEFGTWLGFSPAVSGLLEASYQNWMEDPVMKRAPQIRQGDYLYNVDLTWMVENRNPNNYQRIRRVGVTSANVVDSRNTNGGVNGIKNGATGGSSGSHGAKEKDASTEGDAGAKASGASDGVRYGTVDSKLWKELRVEAEELGEEVKKLQRARADDEASYGRQASAREAELQALQDRCQRQEKELDELARELETEREESQRLQRHLSGILPGRLVTFTGEASAIEPDSASCSDLPGGADVWERRGGGRSLPHLGLLEGAIGRVRAVEGASAAVAFASSTAVTWLPAAWLLPARAAELAARPGSRVRWRLRGGGWRLGGAEDRGEDAGPVAGANPDDASLQRGVVCEPLEGMKVLVLRAKDGRRCVQYLNELELEDAPPIDQPLQPGDFVRVVASSETEAEDSVVGAAGDGGTSGQERTLRGFCGSDAAGVGVVLRRDAATGLCSARFRREGAGEEDAGYVDLSLLEEGSSWPAAPGRISSASVAGGHRGLRLRRDATAERARPGAAVLVRPDLAVGSGSSCGGAGDTSGVGVVYATHGDGSAVVDFLGCMGFRCNVADLEVVDAPSTPGHALLCLLSECLAWNEIATLHVEESRVSELRSSDGMQLFLDDAAACDSIAHSAKVAEAKGHQALKPPSAG